MGVTRMARKHRGNWVADYRDQFGKRHRERPDGPFENMTLQRLAAQIRAGKLQVKLFLRYGLHAKLYLCFPNTYTLPAIGFVGSSNLTFSGLRRQGELNVDVKDDDACRKLAAWFEDRWTTPLSSRSGPPTRSASLSSSSPLRCIPTRSRQLAPSPPAKCSICSATSFHPRRLK